ncbi:MAG: hypothetical protein KTR31_00785 [Myxococcales bacterium]|nr:hypothetical protein [Myxococcales bacterium]
MRTTTVLLWTLLASAGCSLDDASHLPEPSAMMAQRLGGATSLFGVASTGQRLLVFRSTPGTFVIDDAAGDFRIVHRDGETWFATRTQPPERTPQWSPVLGAMTQLVSLDASSLTDATPKRFGVGEGRPWDPDRDGSVSLWTVPVSPVPIRVHSDADGTITRVAILRDDGTDRAFDVALPGVRRTPSGDGRPRSMTSDVWIHYLRTDVPLETDWSTLHRAQAPPLPTHLCGGSDGRCDGYRLGDNPAPEHEVVTELVFDGEASGRVRRHVVVNDRCLQPGSARHPFTLDLRPSTEGNAWRDARRAHRDGCSLVLSARTQLHTRAREGSRVCLQDARLELTAGGRVLDVDTPADQCAEWQTDPPRSTHRARTDIAEHTVAERTISVPPGADLSTLRATWRGDLVLDCLTSPSFAQAQTQADVVLTWECP